MKNLFDGSDKRQQFCMLGVLKGCKGLIELFLDSQAGADVLNVDD